MNRPFALASLVALTGALAPAAPADDKKPSPEQVAKGQDLVKKHLDGLKGGAGAIVAPIAGDDLGRALPDHLFYSVLYRRYPLAQRPADGLSAANVFAVSRDGKVETMKDGGELGNFIVKNAKAATDDEAKDAARAAVRLSQELYQDGFYTFTLQDDSTKVVTEDGKRTANARSMVTKGGNGEVTVTVKFHADGSIAQVNQNVNDLKPGPRPKCQATLLLHADPLVRSICEDDLLIMGKAALPYLAEQRAKATSELQKEIDRVVKRIQAGER
jgi:hypothetical protein